MSQKYDVAVNLIRKRGPRRKAMRAFVLLCCSTLGGSISTMSEDAAGGEGKGALLLEATTTLDY